MKKLKKKENIIIAVILVIMVIAIIGVSYAAFNFGQLGNKPNTITTGAISMTYTESDNTISLGNALPTTDKTGTTRLKEGEYFDFTVSSEIKGNVNINYEVSAKEVGDGTIDGSNIKLYLTEIVDGKEEPLMTPETYNEEPSENTYTGRPANEMSLYTSSMNSSEEHTFRLRMYVTEEYNPQGDGGGLTFTVQVNVYGKAGDKYVPTAVDTLLTKVNSEALDYNSASPEQQKEMWTFTHPETEQTEALTDYRYIGSNPNNYVTFNDELWRIIGVFTVDDGTGKKEQRLKIMRNESIGDYIWNSGFNNWDDATLNFELNLGGYWTDTLNVDAKDMIDNAIWYLGGSDSDNDVTASMFYERERGTNVYEGRSTSWTGKVGLMYPSDYGYATSGGTTTDRNACLNNEIFNWGRSDFSDCKDNDWIFNSTGHQWTITPRATSSAYVFYVRSEGTVYYDASVGNSNSVRPVTFLKSSVKIIDGDGSSSNPYILQS